MLAKHVAMLRIDAADLGLDNKCLQVLDSLEKDIGVPRKVRKQALRRATELRKSYPFGEDERGDSHERGGPMSPRFAMRPCGDVSFLTDTFGVVRSASCGDDDA
jgi:hypothetical protein